VAGCAFAYLIVTVELVALHDLWLVDTEVISLGSQTVLLVRTDGLACN
jgi:hypothetical protein